jgi:hypothetical protein
MSRFLAGVSINYYVEPPPIDEIKKIIILIMLGMSTRIGLLLNENYIISQT